MTFMSLINLKWRRQLRLSVLISTTAPTPTVQLLQNALIFFSSWGWPACWPRLSNSPNTLADAQEPPPEPGLWKGRKLIIQGDVNLGRVAGLFPGWRKLKWLSRQMRLLSGWKLCEGHWKKSPLNFSLFLTTVLGEHTVRRSSVGDELVSDEYITPYWNVWIMSFFSPAAFDSDFSKSNAACPYTATVYQVANRKSCLPLNRGGKKSPSLFRYGKLAIELHLLYLWAAAGPRNQNHRFVEMCKSYQSDLVKVIQKASQWSNWKIHILNLYFVTDMWCSVLMILNARATTIGPVTQS